VRQLDQVLTDFRGNWPPKAACLDQNLVSGTAVAARRREVGNSITLPSC
jgi:hypothetical protein